jgi:hypothetical protein
MEFLRFTSMQTQRIASWDVNPQSRPKISNNTKSFSRLDTTPSPPLPRSRANTLQGAIPELNFTASSALPPIGDEDGKNDIFSADEGLVASPTSETTTPVVKQPETFEELPIEIRSLTER